MIRDIAIAISLANLCLMKVWTYVNSTYAVDKQYHSQLIPNMNYYFAATFNIFLLAVFFWVAATLARKSKKPTIIKIAKVAFILTITIPVYILISCYIIKTLSIIFIITLSILLLRMHFYSRRDITYTLTNVVLILFTFFVFNLTIPVINLLRVDASDFKDKPLAEAVKVKEQTSNRVIWIIFDEMDQRLTFEDRSSTIKLPEIDLFKSQALYANNAYPPAGQTDLSLPSLITGKMFFKYKAVCPNDLILTLSENNQDVEWSKIPNVFSRAHDLGFNTALIGWYLPYGRVIGNNLTSCSWHSHEDYNINTFSEAMVQQIELFVNSIPLLEYCDLLETFFNSDELKLKERMNTYLEIMDESKKAAVNPEFDLILIHFPVPHPPGFYDRKKNDFSFYEHSYLDNLTLADRTLGELRNVMENTDSNIWDNTTVIISSDHCLRYKYWSQKKCWANEEDVVLNKNLDYRVPFMLKLAGQKNNLNYIHSFNTIITHDLILTLLTNEISTSDDVAKWIDKERSNWPIPEYSNAFNIIQY